MKNIIITFLTVLLLITLGTSFWYFQRNPGAPSLISPLLPSPEPERPLLRYSFEALSQTQFQPSTIELLSLIEDTPEFDAYLFAIRAGDKRITGQINLPTNYQSQPNPVILMNRGYADTAIYRTGVGTRNAAAVYARNGFVTIAPDFAGFGGSDPESIDSFEARLEKPVTVLTLLESIKELDYIDSDNVFLWGHSNGGQIALSILEITNRPIPTTLWAPVTKAFPYSILFFSDELRDYGKAMRKSLAQFEELYDTDLFTLQSYLDRINAPIQLHQGSADEAVPIEWSNDFVKDLSRFQDSTESAQLDITYYTYSGMDHNMQPGWDTVVARDLTFFRQHLK